MAGLTPDSQLSNQESGALTKNLQQFSAPANPQTPNNRAQSNEFMVANARIHHVIIKALESEISDPIMSGVYDAVKDFVYVTGVRKIVSPPDALGDLLKALIAIVPASAPGAGAPGLPAATPQNMTQPAQVQAPGPDMQMSGPGNTPPGPQAV